MSATPILLAVDRHPGAAVGSSYHDICVTPSLCAACSVWQRPDETRTAWLTRLGALHRADMADTAKYGPNRRPA
jgi:hypothetical protein